MRSARVLRAVTTRVPIRGTLRLAYLLVGPPSFRASPETVVDTGRYRAWVAFHNPPEVQLFFHGRYEPDLTAVLDAFLRPGDVAVDIGCNCGVVTLEMACRVGKSGHVIAVDPSPAAADRTGQQAALNGYSFVDVRHVALESEQRGKVRYYQATVGIGALPGAEMRHTTGMEVGVSSTTLDLLLSDSAASRVDFLKIDTDGHEMAVLTGGQRVLARRPLIVLEITPDAMRRNGDDPGALFTLLDRLGYSFLVPRKTFWSYYDRHHRIDGAALLASGYEGNLVAYQPRDPRHTGTARLLTRRG